VIVYAIVIYWASADSLWKMGAFRGMQETHANTSDIRLKWRIQCTPRAIIATCVATHIGGIVVDEIRNQGAEVRL
jgi:hypothetical protein